MTDAARLLVVHSRPGGPLDALPAHLAGASSWECKVPDMHAPDLAACVDLQQKEIKEFDPDVIIAVSTSGAEVVALATKASDPNPRTRGFLFVGLDAQEADRRLGVRFDGNEPDVIKDRVAGPVVVLVSNTRGRTSSVATEGLQSLAISTTIADVASDSLLLPTVHPTHMEQDREGKGVAKAPEEMEATPRDITGSHHAPNAVRIVEIEGATSPDQVAEKVIETGELEGWITWLVAEVRRHGAPAATA